MFKDLSQLSQKMIRQLLRMHAACDYEIYVVRRSGVSLNVKDGAQESCDLRETTGMALRLFHQGKRGFGFGTDSTPRGLAALIEGAWQGANLMKEEAVIPWHDRSATVESVHSLPAIADVDFAKTTLAEKWRLATELEALARKIDSRITQVPMASFEDELEQILICDSSGRELRQWRTISQLSLAVLATGSGGDETVFDHRHALCCKNLDATELAHTATAKVLASLGGAPVAAASLPAVIAPEVMAEFLEVLAPTFFADRMAKKTSCFAEKIGQLVLAPCLTLVDDGLLAGGFGTAHFDAEGTPRGRHVLVEGGKMITALCDATWGRRIGRTSTGNAVREHLGALPEIGVNNLYFQAGHESPAELRSRYTQAVEITDVIGMHMADSVSGDFSVGFQGFLLQNGERCQALKSMTISGNLHVLLAQATGVGNDLRFYGQFGSPTVLVPQIVISG